jgi:5'-nucleotidase
VRRIAKNVLREGLPDHVDVLNINFPHDVDNDTEIEFTRLSPKLFGTSVEERRDPRGRPYYWIAGDSLSSGEEGTDVHAVVQNGHISVTPLSLDSTSGIDFSELEKLV